MSKFGTDPNTTLHYDNIDIDSKVSDSHSLQPIIQESDQGDTTPSIQVNFKEVKKGSKLKVDSNKPHLVIVENEEDEKDGLKASKMSESNVNILTYITKGYQEKKLDSK